MAKTHKIEIPNIVFEQPLFQNERIAADWKHMRSQITSATQLEAAYRVIAPEVAALRLRLSEGDAQQLLALYNKTVTDGRYLRDLMTDPAGVAAKLGVPLSAAAGAAIKRVGTIQALQTATGEATAATAIVAVVVIAVVIVIVFGPKRPRKQLVVDSSGIVKM